ncbi:MAG: toll/interleukin-1 receptor domain-containing protein [Chitinophagaceae bacterium]|jgi:hypothetical protein
MKAFISYSHKDSEMLERLHTHLIQLKREGKLTTWTDEEIAAGGKLQNLISSNLNSSQIFLALLSPDYIASGYCYEKEFMRAQELMKSGSIILVPIILEPCDWLNTPFADFKALPKDGKPVSEWSNVNTAFLDIIQNLRILLSNSIPLGNYIDASSVSTIGYTSSKNYRVKKDFDSIQKIEFTESAFNEIKERLESYLKEIIHIDEQIKYRITLNDSKNFEAILVNRNKTNVESTIKLSNDSEMRVRGQFSNYSTMLGKHDIAYTIGSERDNRAKGFELSFDEYHLFWKESSIYGGQSEKEINPRNMADDIWKNWLESVGIM